MIEDTPQFVIYADLRRSGATHAEALCEIAHYWVREINHEEEIE